MAEAGVETAASSNRFFCHKCNVEITPNLPDYVCPRCNSGFIEELDGRAENSDSDTSSDMDLEQFDTWDMLQDVTSGGQGASSSPSGSASGPGTRRSQRLRHLNPRHGRRRVSGGERHALAPLIHDLIMQMTTGVIEASVGGPEFAGAPIGIDLPGFPVLVASNLASNPGDYAWGRGGLDAIITQLMNQLDGTGPPPLSRDQISQIPTVNITKDQAEQGLQCSVCMEDFKEDEGVRQLHCEHCYHSDCIIPWLELHGTCPVCRKLLLEDGQVLVGGNSASSGNSSTGPGERSPRRQGGQSTASVFISSSSSSNSSSTSSSSGTYPTSSTTNRSSSSSRSSSSRAMFEDELD